MYLCTHFRTGCVLLGRHGPHEGSGSFQGSPLFPFSQWEQVFPISSQYCTNQGAFGSVLLVYSPFYHLLDIPPLSPRGCSSDCQAIHLQPASEARSHAGASSCPSLRCSSNSKPQASLYTTWGGQGYCVIPVPRGSVIGLVRVDLDACLLFSYHFCTWDIFGNPRWETRAPWFLGIS